MKAIINTIMNKLDHDCRYTMGMLPLGKVVAAQITYVGNAMHGRIARSSAPGFMGFPRVDLSIV